MSNLEKGGLSETPTKPNGLFFGVMEIALVGFLIPGNEIIRINPSPEGIIIGELLLGLANPLPGPLSFLITVETKIADSSNHEVDFRDPKLFLQALDKTLEASLISHTEITVRIGFPLHPNQVNSFESPRLARLPH